MSPPDLRDRAVLVVGADGGIGRAIVEAAARARAHVIEAGRRPGAAGRERVHLDLARPIEDLRLTRAPYAAFLCAAITDLATCERDPEGTARVNVEHTVDLARRLVAGGAWVGFLSTNIVFDGTVPHRRAEDPISPPIEYGRQKARAEAALFALGPSTAALRLTKVVGPTTEPFASWVRALRAGQPVDAFSDKVCAPVSMRDTVEVLLAMAARRMSGLFQASAARDLPYDEVAAFLAQRVGARPEQVRAVRGRERAIPEAFLPQHTTLDATRLREELSWTPPEPQEALKEGLGL